MKSVRHPQIMQTKPMDVAILVLPESNTLTLAAAVDPLRAANRQAERAVFNWCFVTAGDAPAPLTSGLVVQGQPIATLSRCDLLVVIAGFGLRQHDTPALRASLRRLAETGAPIAGLDGGPWLMAAAGLLDGYVATTHWEDWQGFSERFPDVTMVPSRYQIDRDRMTGGGAGPALDLMLELIGDRFSVELAQKVASALIYDPVPDSARPQSRFAALPHNTVTARAQRLMEARLDAPLTIPQIARTLGLSARTLELQFRKGLGTTPKAHYLRLRLREAHRLVCDSQTPLYEIALATGFASQSRFAHSFRRAFGQSASALRRGRARP